MAQTSKEIIDTSVLVDYLRSFPKAKDFLDSFKVRNISAVTAMEIVQGSGNKRELEVNLSFLKKFKILSIDNEISDLAMELMKNYRLKYDLEIPDALIAATTLSKNKTLITKNIKDFKFIKNLKLLTPY